MEFFTELFYLVIGLLTDLTSFLSSVWNVLIDFVDYLTLVALRFYIDSKIMMVEIAYGVANSILVNYEVYTLISGAFNKLPPDLAFTAHAFGVVEAVRIVIDAAATAFILRVIGW